MSNNHEEHERPPGFWGSRFSIGFMFIGAVAGYLLLTEHLAYVVGALPLAAFLQPSFQSLRHSLFARQPV